MRLFLQDRADAEAPSLQETILELCTGATRGGGAFAFVTRAGVELLLKDPLFRAFATKAEFDLVVGVDSCTDVSALNALQETSNELPRLRVRVFLHDVAGSLFHPKFCWFAHKSKGFLIVGSGNLTARGLRGSWEAFSVTELNAKDLRTLEAQWARWIELHNEQLRPLDHTGVRTQAARNVPQRMPAQPRPRLPEVETELETVSEPVPTESLQVLVAEIPRAAGRRNQANFDLESFRNFFGARPGKVHRVILQSVDSSGALGRLENRPSVSVKSRNFRFELEAASGLRYPNAGRPIGVFVRIAPGTFRYFLSMPGQPDHSILESFLSSNWNGRSDRVRRIITDTRTLTQVWPNSPLWVSPLEVQD